MLIYVKKSLFKLQTSKQNLRTFQMENGPIKEEKSLDEAKKNAIIQQFLITFQVRKKV